MKIFRFIKKLFFSRLTILSSFTNASSLSCISISDQACKARPEIINVNNIINFNPVFYPFSIKTNKCKELMKQDIQNGMKLVNVNVDQMQLFVIINNVGIKINAEVNSKN